MIRGINGAGKSTLVRLLMERYPPAHTEFSVGLFTKQKPRAVWYDLPTGIRVLGNYEYHRMGGLDGFKPAEVMWRFIVDAYRGSGGITIMESALLSQAKGRIWKDPEKRKPDGPVPLVDQVGGENVLLATLDTPLELCFRRIYQRQRDENKERKIKEDVIEYLHGRIRKIHEYMEEHGVCETVWLDHQHPLTHLEETMRRYGWTGGEA